MQFRVVAALLVFIGSYLPLSLILLAQNYDYSFAGQTICWEIWRDECVLPFKNPYFAIGIFLSCMICFIITIVMLSVLRPKRQVIIKEAKYVPADLMNYTLPYIVSFMSIDYQESGKFVGFIIFLCWMFWITYKSGQILLNPVLIVMGWRLYDTTYAFRGGREDYCARALVKGHIERGQIYRQIQVQDVLLIKNEHREDG